MKRFFDNLKKYYKYAIYSAKADLKAEVAGSYLNWVWWILDPLCFMLIYMFITIVVFGSKEPNIAVFVFIGLTCWDYFNRNVSASVKLVNNNRPIVSKIYVPKYILVLQKSFVNLFKMAISWVLVLILMVLHHIPFTLNMLYFIPIMITFYLVTFGICCILLHFGIFVEDLANITNLVLRLVFYLSGIFYKIKKRVPKPFNHILLKANPAAFVIDAFRTVLMNGKVPNFKWLGIWFIIGTVLTYIGVKVIHKYENSYVKVI